MSSRYDDDVEFEEMEDEGSLGEYEEFFDEEFDFAAVGIDPMKETDAKPGSEDKVLMLAARYAAGLPLWHDEDRYDHGPGKVADENEL